MPNESQAKIDGQHYKALNIESLVIADDHSYVARILNRKFKEKTIVDRLNNHIFTESKSASTNPHQQSMYRFKHKEKMHTQSFCNFFRSLQQNDKSPRRLPPEQPVYRPPRDSAKKDATGWRHSKYCAYRNLKSDLSLSSQALCRRLSNLDVALT